MTTAGPNSGRSVYASTRRSSSASARPRAWAIRVTCQARGKAEAELLRLIEAHTERPLFGPAVVNVLALNLALADNPSTSTQ